MMRRKETSLLVESWRSFINEGEESNKKNEEQEVLDKAEEIKDKSGNVVKRGALRLRGRSITGYGPETGKLLEWCIMKDFGENYDKFPICQFTLELKPMVKNPQNVFEAILSKCSKSDEIGSSGGHIVLQILNFASAVQKEYGANTKEFKKEDLEYVDKFTDESRNGWKFKK